MTAVVNGSVMTDHEVDEQWGPRSNVGEVERAVAALAAGQSVVLHDDTGDGHGYLVHCASSSIAEVVAFLVRYSSGYVRVAITDESADRMNLPPMVHGGALSGENYTVAVDASALTGTGISASDRAETIRLLGSPSTVPSDFTRPGHVLPVRVSADEERRLPGHGALELAQRACDTPAAAYAEIVADGDGVELARGVQVSIFASRHGLPLVRLSRI